MKDKWDLKTIAECASSEAYSTQIGPFGNKIRAKIYTPTGTPVLRGTNVNTEERFNDDDFVFIDSELADEEFGKFVCKAGDVILCHKGTIGKIGIIPKKNNYGHYVMGNSMMKVRCDQKKLLPLYLYYWLNSNEGQHYLFSRLSQVGVPQIQRPLSTLREATLPIPPLPEQRAIAHILGSLDDKIELNRRMNETLEAMAQAMFKSWFVDFDPVIDNALAAGNEIPETLKEKAAVRKSLGDARKPLPEEIRNLFPSEFEYSDEMGWIPKGWEVKQIGDLLELAYGKSLSAKKRIPGEYPVYGSGGIGGFHNKALCKGPGIIVGRKGTVGSVYWEEGDFFPIDTVFFVKLKRVTPLYWVYQNLLQMDIASLGADSAVPGVNRNAVYVREWILPNNDLLNKYWRLLSSEVLKMQKLKIQNKTLSNLRDTLLPKLLSGEIRIPEKGEV